MASRILFRSLALNTTFQLQSVETDKTRTTISSYKSCLKSYASHVNIENQSAVYHKLQHRPSPSESFGSLLIVTKENSRPAPRAKFYLSTMALNAKIYHFCYPVKIGSLLIATIANIQLRGAEKYTPKKG